MMMENGNVCFKGSMQIYELHFWDSESFNGPDTHLF